MLTLTRAQRVTAQGWKQSISPTDADAGPVTRGYLGDGMATRDPARELQGPP